MVEILDLASSKGPSTGASVPVAEGLGAVPPEDDECGLGIRTFLRELDAAMVERLKSGDIVSMSMAIKYAW